MSFRPKNLFEKIWILGVAAGIGALTIYVLFFQEATKVVTP
jgi:hypothetical protein